VNDQELQSAFGEFLKTLSPAQKSSIVGFVPDDATLAREKAFSKYQELENVSKHCNLLGGSARADALKAWHRIMSEFYEAMDGLDPHPVEEPKNAVETKAPNT
jgi:hypothetical protein